MNLTPFTNDEFALDVQATPDGGFVVLAPGLARALGFRESFDMLRSLPDAEKGSELVRTPGGEQRVGVVTEAGFYRALGQRQSARITDDATRAQVERFQSWVYTEVLPSIRKHGGYLTPAAIEQTLTDPDFIIRLATQLRDEKRRRWQAETEVESQRQHLRLVEPKAAAFDRWMGSGAEYPIDVAAKALAAAGYFTGRNRLFDELGDLGWAYKDKAGWHPYQQHGPEGTKRLTVRVHYYDDPESGEARGKTTLKITAKGIADLAKVHGILPDAIKDATERSAA